jgi:hypothetical protein
MIERIENLWHLEADAKCITTNGFVKNNGEAVMGAGIAKQAKLFYPKLPLAVGLAIQVLGNHVTPFVVEKDNILFTFPVKHNWWEKADLELIERSASELVEWVDEINQVKEVIETVALPRPGCGNGQRDWEEEVKVVIEPILDDRFVVVELVK